METAPAGIREAEALKRDTVIIIGRALYKGRRGGGSLSGKWNGGGGRSCPQSSSRWSVGGVLGARPFVRKCWRPPASGWGHYGAERQEVGEARARRLVKDGMRELGWTEAELSRRAKGDKLKVTLARRLRAETTMTLARIANRLQMGSWTYVSNLLHEKNQ